jgi:proteasome accessory factor C
VSARRDAGERLRRLLVMIPWLAARRRATFEEIAERFALTPEEVEEELLLAACCGLPPYSPDMLIELIVDDDGVTAEIPDYFRRPLQLSATDGFAILTAGRAMLAVPGADPDGPLARALQKLEGALGVAGGGSGVTVELETPEHLDRVREAAAAGERLEVDYYSASRDQLTTRRIDPLVVYASQGRWYVDAHCHRAAGVLHFRVDRVRAVRPTGEHFEAEPVDPPTEAVFTPGPETRSVTLAIPPDGRWVVESYPTGAVEELPDGRLRVELSIGGQAWLERLLLRLGATAEVLHPPELAGLPRAAAERVLAAYRRGG